jgi:hypothetical protein
LIGTRRNDPVSRYNDKFTAMLFDKFVPVVFVEFPLIVRREEGGGRKDRPPYYSAIPYMP